MSDQSTRIRNHDKQPIGEEEKNCTLPRNLAPLQRIRRVSVTSIPSRILQRLWTPPSLAHPPHSPSLPAPLSLAQGHRCSLSNGRSIRTSSTLSISDMSAGIDPLGFHLSLGSLVPQYDRKTRVEDRMAMSRQRYDMVWSETGKEWASKYGGPFPHVQDDCFRRQVEFNFYGIDDSAIMRKWRIMWKRNDANWTEFKFIAHLREISLQHQLCLWRDTGRYHSQTVELWERLAADDWHSRIAAARQAAVVEVSSTGEEDVIAQPEVKRSRRQLGRERRTSKSNARSGVFGLSTNLSRTSESGCDSNIKSSTSKTRSRASSVAAVGKLLFGIFSTNDRRPGPSLKSVSPICSESSGGASGIAWSDFAGFSGLNSGSIPTTPDGELVRRGGKSQLSDNLFSPRTPSVVTHEASPILFVEALHQQPEELHFAQPLEPCADDHEWLSDIEDWLTLKERPEPGDEGSEAPNILQGASSLVCDDDGLDENVLPLDYIGESEPGDRSTVVSHVTAPTCGIQQPISRQMTASQVVSHLVAHGCRDLTDVVDHTSLSEHPVSHGGFSDVYSGRLQNKTQTAIKILRISMSSITQNPKHLKQAARELHTWSKCAHPNVLPLLGLVVFRGRIGMVSPWMRQGNLPRYLERRPDVNRCNLCVHICNGLSYLHQIGVVHGDLKGANVLISNDGAPVLTDFGNSLLKDRTMVFTQTTSGNSLSLRWSSAELITGSGVQSKESDVYALAMTIYEVMAGILPYNGHREHTIIYLVVTLRKPPERLKFIPVSQEDSDKFWNLLLQCWSFEPKARPSAEEVVAIMNTISVDG